MNTSLPTCTSMRPILKMAVLSFFLISCILYGFEKARAQTGKCNWSTKGISTSFWDSCNGRVNPYSVNGAVYLKISTKCYTFLWTVNGTSAGTGSTLTYPVTKNGYYNVCVKITDTCARCDTTICSRRQISCVSTPCDWKNFGPNLITWDSCGGSRYPYSVNGSMGFKSGTGCFKYEWTVNGVSAGNGSIMSYPITKNGKYDICVKASDTCNKCDTTYCVTRTVTCLPTPCQWATYAPYSYFWDTCNASRSSLSAYIAFKSSGCFKYEWTVNGKSAGNGVLMNHPITQNGTYNVCVKVSDTCNSCDTTMCSTRIINCMPTPCKWQTFLPTTYFSDSCQGKSTQYSVNGKILFKNNSSCFKYDWKINGNSVGSGNNLNYPITKNGTYVVCVTVYDTCNVCDTSFCDVRVINCIPTPCNWMSYTPYVSIRDTCEFKSSINGYITFQRSTGCFKYLWTINGNAIGTGGSLNYSLTQNGTYNVCVKVTDTCNSCDTTFCMTKVVTCMPTPCKWSTYKPYSYFWDTCNSKSASVNGYVILYGNTSCFKYEWTVNGNKVGSGAYTTYPITQNGTYDLCVRIIDTCNNCDTTICSKRQISCFATPCGWNSFSPTAQFWDTCRTGAYSVNGYLYFKKSIGCLTYNWTVNGSYAGNSYVMSYPITKNGTYVVCVKVSDTCNACDTTYCSTRVITCITNGIGKRQLSPDVLTIYPNPATTSVSLSWELGNSHYILTNISGQTVLNGTLQNGMQTLDLSLYPAGLYCIHVQTEDAVLTRKLILLKE